MKKSDFRKTAEELESDSCFDLLTSCLARIALVQERLAALRQANKPLQWGSVEERANLYAQERAAGELLGLSYCQGGLEAHCRMKTQLAAIARRHEASVGGGMNQMRIYEASEPN